jgi:hypothetical protein
MAEKSRKRMVAGAFILGCALCFLAFQLLFGQMSGDSTGVFPPNGIVPNPLITPGNAFFTGPSPWIDVKTYGATGNTKRSQAGTCTSGSTAISASGFFTSTAVDGGKTIQLSGCGASGAALATTISSVTDANDAVIATSASTSVSGTSTFIMGTDDTAAVQAAINAAKTGHSGGIVFFPPGVYMISQIIPYAGVNLIGSGVADQYGGTGAGGSEIQQKPGTDLDVIAPANAASYFQSTEMYNFSLQGALGTTASSGINFAAEAPNYGTILHHLMIGNFALDGIKLSYGFDSCHIFDIGSGGNGVGAGGGYGVELIGGGGAPQSLCGLDHIYGDNNQTALIHLKSASGMGNVQGYHLSDIVGEKTITGRQNDLIVTDTMNGTPVVVEGAVAQNNSGEEADAVIKNVNSTVRLSWSGLNAVTDAVHGTGNGYSYMVNDAYSSVTYPLNGNYASGSNGGFATLNQPAAKTFAGTCAMSSGTTCTFTATATFNSTPICVASDQGGAIAGTCALSTGTVTITAASSNSSTWGAVLIGNPN